MTLLDCLQLHSASNTNAQAVAVVDGSKQRDTDHTTLAISLHAPEGHIILRDQKDSQRVSYEFEYEDFHLLQVTNYLGMVMLSLFCSSLSFNNQFSLRIGNKFPDNAIKLFENDTRLQAIRCYKEESIFKYQKTCNRQIEYFQGLVLFVSWLN